VSYTVTLTTEEHGQLIDVVQGHGKLLRAYQRSLGSRRLDAALDCLDNIETKLLAANDNRPVLDEMLGVKP
jgi:hypothetical protein